MNNHAMATRVLQSHTAGVVSLWGLAWLLPTALLSACATNRDHLMTSINYGTEPETTAWLRAHAIDDIDGVPPRVYEPGVFGGNLTNSSTALFAAVERGWGELTRALLDKGASPNVASAQGRTPLMIAASGGDQAILKLLLERGADIQARDRSGDDALIYSVCPAERGRDVKVYAELMRKILEQLVSPATPMAAALAETLAKEELHLEITRGSKGELRLDLDKAADFAAATTTLLLNRGAPVNTRNGNGETALLRAVRCGQWLHALLLLRRGADINMASAAGRTPLLVAIESDLPALAVLLLQQGAEVNVGGAAGRTPLLVAIESHLPVLAVSLLERGADASKADDKGYSPLRAGLAQIDDVCCRGCSDRQELTRGTTLGFNPAQCSKSVGLLKALYRKGAVDREARGVLWAAHALCEDYDMASTDIYEIGRLSVLAGADFTAKSDFFQTPAIFSFVHSHAKHVCTRQADRSQDLAMVELLMSKGGDPNVTYPGRDGYFRPGESILHLALREGDWKVALLLLRRGARLSDTELTKRVPAFGHQERACAEGKDPECDDFHQVVELMTRAKKD